MAPHRGSAVLTLGILSLVICGIILGPIAWAMGHADLNEMRAGRMDPEGEGMTCAKHQWPRHIVQLINKWT